MPHSDEFVEHLLEQMQYSGIHGAALRAKRMFGGYGIYFDNVMFALITDNTLYYKVADNNIANFESRQLQAFSYQRQGKRLTMSYYEAPSEIYDEPEAMRYWTHQAIDASRLAKNYSANTKPPRRN